MFYQISHQEELDGNSDCEMDKSGVQEQTSPHPIELKIKQITFQWVTEKRNTVGARNPNMFGFWIVECVPFMGPTIQNQNGKMVISLDHYI